MAYREGLMYPLAIVLSGYIFPPQSTSTNTIPTYCILLSIPRRESMSVTTPRPPPPGGRIRPTHSTPPWPITTPGCASSRTAANAPRWAAGDTTRGSARPEAAIRRWQQEGLLRNVGIVCGAVSEQPRRARLRWPRRLCRVCCAVPAAGAKLHCRHRQRGRASTSTY